MLIDGSQTTGLHQVVWDGTDDRGTLVSSGVYFSSLVTDQTDSRRKMVLLK